MAWAVRTLLGMFKVFSLRTTGPDGWEEKIALQQKLFHLGAFADDSLGRCPLLQAPNSAIPCVYYLTNHDFVMLDRIIAVGFDPSAIQRHIVSRQYISEFTNRAVARRTIINLYSRGFHLPKTIIVDERAEPALRSVPALISGESESNSALSGLPHTVDYESEFDDDMNVDDDL